jgi:UDP-N-acetylmuramate dehydrogenase
MEIREQVPLSDYTTLQVGGPARYFCVANTPAELAVAQQFASEKTLPLLVIGTGSNILASDAGFDGLVVHNALFGREYTQLDTNRVIAQFGAGESLDEVIADTVGRGYWGLENLSHIPGTVGATPVQNVGAYGVEVKDLIVEVIAQHSITTEIKTFSNAECAFGYRDSYFKTAAGKEWVITAVTFVLHSIPQPKLAYKDLAALAQTDLVTQDSIRDHIIAVRSKKFPDWYQVGTAGSFFKNPIIPSDHAAQLKQKYPALPIYPVAGDQTKVSLGFILDQVCNLKGYADGAVRLYEQQALVLINTGTSATAVTAFAAYVAAQVFDKTGITIEQEVTTV